MKTEYKKLILIETIIISALIFTYILVISGYISFVPKCYFISNYGILCPSCGCTRCINSLLKGDLIEAIKYNAVFFITIIYLIILNTIYIINNFKKNKILEKIYPKWWYLIIWVIILLIYTLIRNII